MRPDVAKVAMQFLQRCELKGIEVPAFNQVMMALKALANPPPLPPGEAPARATS